MADYEPRELRKCWLCEREIGPQTDMRLWQNYICSRCAKVLRGVIKNPPKSARATSVLSMIRQAISSEPTSATSVLLTQTIVVRLNRNLIAYDIRLITPSLRCCVSRALMWKSNKSLNNVLWQGRKNGSAKAAIGRFRSTRCLQRFRFRLGKNTPKNIVCVHCV